MRHWLLILFILFIPLMSFASVGDDLNRLIDRFFGEGQAPLEEVSDETFEETVLPDFVSPENLDLESVQKTIFLEEENLEHFENTIREKEQLLTKVKSDNNSIENQLFLLDSQIGFNTEKYDQYVELEKKWKKELESLTREKSETKALLRQLKRDYELFMSKNFVRKENLQSNAEISILQWLFSARSVSEILEDRRNASFSASKKKAQLQQVQAVKKALDTQEKKTAMLYDRMNYLGRQVSREKLVLSNMAGLKAKILAQNESSQDELEFALASAQEEQVKSTVYLQALHQQLLAVKDKTKSAPKVEEEPLEQGQEDLSIFDWPLAIPIKIETEFRDPEYKKELGKDHDGIDIDASQGTSVIAPADGVVKKVIFNGYGYAYLILEHGNDLFTVYGHLSNILVKKGDIVSYGQEIARTGGTPGVRGSGFFTSGPHLHFEVFHNGRQVDPLKYLPVMN